ncbi:MAG: glycosyltransferase [Anaerolineae bacterium]|nr:glycosyltransferase family 4 protein [Anaerolineae bacterium]MDW8068966.1 glycosyltransferase [Anaerolineae bacterium]
MRVVVIGRTYALEINRAKWTYLPDEVRLFLVTPDKIRHTLKVYPAELSTRWPHFLLKAWGTNRLSGFAFHPLKLWSLLRSLRPDLIQVDEEPSSLALLEVMLLKRGLKCPVLFFSWENLPIRYRWPFSAIRRFNLHRADGAIAGTQEAGQRLREAGFSGPMAVIPQLGVDPERFAPRRNDSLRRQLGLRTFTIGYLGRLVPEKGLWVLLDALSSLQGDWQCLLVGEGPLREKGLQQAQRRSIRERVFWIPTVPHTAVPEYLNTIDVVVLPSLTTERWKEQFGHILIEAMACGVPVIGSDSGAIPEVIGDAGLIVPEGNPLALAQAIDFLRSSELQRATLGRKGRERVLALYTNERICRQTLGFWQEVLDARTSFCR